MFQGTSQTIRVSLTHVDNRQVRTCEYLQIFQYIIKHYSKNFPKLVLMFHNQRQDGYPVGSLCSREPHRQLRSLIIHSRFISRTTMIFSLSPPQGKYTTKSDVWSFAVTLWEILTFARETPYQQLSNDEVMQNLSHLHYENGLFAYLPKPPCPKDIFDLMLECWRRHELERPSFREIHLFLQRKNLGYAPVV